MIHQKHRPTETEQEAADWYARLNSTVIENKDLSQFEAWRKSPENRAAYDQVSSTAAKLRGLRGEASLEAMADDAIARADRRKRRRAAGAAAGAGVVLMLAAAMVLGAIRLGENAGERYESLVGERKVVRLDDGSEVILNTDSKIAVRLTRGERRVTLVRGQALFDVAHDTSRPFVVTAGRTSVTAIGTRFDVYRRVDAVQVTLTEGKVAVRERANQGRSWTLAPGQKIVVDRTAVARPAPADVTADTSWAIGQLVFHDAPLGQAVAEVNRYSAKKVVLAEGAPKDLRINGTFPTGDVDGFAMAASNILDLETRALSGGKAVELRARAISKP